MVELTLTSAVCIRSFNRIPQSKSIHIMSRGHIETDPSTSSYSRISIGSMFDRDSSSVVRSLIGLFTFRSNALSKVYQHRQRSGGIWEEAWSTGSLRKNSKRHCCWGVNTRSIFAKARIEHARNGSLLKYIIIADAMVNNAWFARRDVAKHMARENIGWLTGSDVRTSSNFA